MISGIRHLINYMNYSFRKYTKKELSGIGVIEIILILVIIIGLVLIFRNQIVAIIQAAFNSITEDSKGINEGITLDDNP